MTETDFELAPAKARVATSGDVAIPLINDGQTVHALALQTGREMRSTGTIEPGKTAALTPDLEPGRYTWFYPIVDHRELGMGGTLTVGGEATEAEPSTPAAPGGGDGY